MSWFDWMYGKAILNELREFRAEQRETNRAQRLRLEKVMAAIDDLQAAVAAEDTVIDSAITLIQGIPALIAAAGTDPAKLAALQTDITTKSKALADAVAANTPAAPPPTP